MYRSPYEAYPFLSDEDSDLRCDFEIGTDRLASSLGYLASLCSEQEIVEELLHVCQLIYHLNPSLRTFFSITDEESENFLQRTKDLEQETRGRYDNFVLPRGSTRASLAHILRADAKSLVRLLYRYQQRGGEVDSRIYDFTHLLSNYFFYLALKFNELDGVEEIFYKSRNY